MTGTTNASRGSRRRWSAISAIDNLAKGAAGQRSRTSTILGWLQTTGLTLRGSIRKKAQGILWAGLEAGIKPNRKDPALVYAFARRRLLHPEPGQGRPGPDAEPPAGRGIRAVVINSGTNALSVRRADDVKTVCEAIAKS